MRPAGLTLAMSVIVKRQKYSYQINHIKKPFLQGYESCKKQ